MLSSEQDGDALTDKGALLPVRGYGFDAIVRPITNGGYREPRCFSLTQVRVGVKIAEYNSTIRVWGMNKNDGISRVLRQKGEEIWSVTPDTTVFDALEMMADKEVGALLVLQGDRLVGVVSERDYARKVILQGRSSKDTAVGDIMTHGVVTVTPAHTVDECMKLMTELRVRHLPVTEGVRISGVVSLGDLVKYVISAQQEEIEHLQAYIAGAYPV